MTGHMTRPGVVHKIKQIGLSWMEIFYHLGNYGNLVSIGNTHNGMKPGFDVGQTNG